MIGGLVRTTGVLAVAGRHLAAATVARLLRPDATRGPERLRRALEEIGGTYLKLGQVLSLQPDVLPRAYCTALFDLLDRVPPVDADAVDRVFAEELGARPTDLFDHFETEPIAAASIAQVHRAWRDGRQLAVKVQRPGVERHFAADLRVMEVLARLARATRLRSLVWLVRAVEEFTTWTREELDFRCEARYMRALGADARQSPTERVPEVVDELSTARVLTAEFLDGPTVLAYIRSLDAPDPELATRLAEMGFDPEVFARRLIENFVSDAFTHGLFHADLHPANLIILPDNVVGYVDFGITGSLSRYSRRHIVSMTLALTRAEPDALADRFFRIATAEAGADPEAFRRELRRLTAAWFSTSGDRTTLEVSYTRVMLDFLQASRRTGIWAMPDALRYLRSVITADGLISRFAGAVDVSRDLERLCEQYLEREMWRRWLTPESLADWSAAAAQFVAEAPDRLAGTDTRSCDLPPPPPDPAATARLARGSGRWLALAATAAGLYLLLPDPPGAGPGPQEALAATAALGATMSLGHLVRNLLRP